MTDLFGKNPLTYAIAAKDQPTLNAMITGIYNLEPSAREEVMR